MVDGQAIAPTTTDLGYTVTLTRCRAALTNLTFTTSGEFHEGGVAALGRHLAGWLVPTAWAHPGHAAGGEVIGELPGRFVVDWCTNNNLRLGDAELTLGQYNGANFEFIPASADDGLDPDDPLIGHSLELAGTAILGDDSFEFHVVLAQDDGREVIGLPFDLDLTAATEVTLGLQLTPRSVMADLTLFDGIDFAALAPDSEELTNRLRRASQDHEFYRIEPLSPES